MSLKRFNADVRAARLEIDDPGISGVINVERGDSEGEAKITFVHKKLDGPILIQILAQNLDTYPDNNSYLFFTDVDDVPSVIASAIMELQNSTLGQPLPKCIHNVSDGLTRALSLTDTGGDVIMSENESDCYEYDEGDAWDDLDDNDIFGSFHGQISSGSKANTIPCPEGLRKLKKDLRAVHLAGCKVGILDGFDDNSPAHTISISMRASKMALSSETLEVWDIEPSDYIVLLIEVKGRYQSIDWLKSNYPSFQMRFRFGKCSSYKPSVEISTNDAGKPEARSTSTTQDTARDESEGKAFTKIFISNSLERFMNEDFIKIVKLRLIGLKSWDDANLQLQDMALTGNFAFAGNLDSNTSKTEVDGGLPQAHDKDDTEVLPDPFTLPHDRISLPLVAMQFATHYFTRCTQYCLRCHRRLAKDFEALKPFVCSNPLCLFQYITLGLGPSIEHEILTQPYVVDLLVSLCYSSVSIPVILPTGQRYPIREFPAGLRLKVPRLPIGTFPNLVMQTIHPFSLNKPLDLIGMSIPVDGDLDGHFVTVIDHEQLHRLCPNTIAVLQQSYLELSDRPLFHHVVIKYVDSQLSRVFFEFKHRAAPLAQAPGATGLRFNKIMALTPYDVEFDDLTDFEKAQAVSVVLGSLPPIVSLRNYLLDHPNGSLTSHPGVSSSAMTLLQWIVASNRSYILQVSPVTESQFPENEISMRNTKTRPQEQIPGLDSEYVQFRFAQGSPEKELRFHRALGNLALQKATKFPTIFAWHGSKLSNWHSILRQGLDYTQIHNGRAYGNGVYFSSHFDISANYAQEALCWPNSALQPTKVVSLCEIINSTKSFVSTNPFLVVPNVDWIQCRYLIVQQKVLHKKATELQKSNDVHNLVSIPQDPVYRAVGPFGAHVAIPVKALPSSRIGLEHINASEITVTSGYESMDTDEEDISDLEAIISDGESLPPSPKQMHSGAMISESLTGFRPGTLDLSSLPRLALPLWADPISSKRLAVEIKRLQKIQTTTPLHELGWYVHLDSLENMFQWIAELHSFDPELPLAKDMKAAGVSSVVLEIRFGRDFPFSPPFVRVIRPRFLPFMSGGGGHVTIGGAICMELLTSTGWTPAHSMEGVFMSIKMAMSSLDPKPARLLDARAKAVHSDYSPWEALEAFQRAAHRHGWQVPQDMKENAAQPSAAAGNAS